MELFLAFFISIWVVVGLIALVVTVVGLCMHLSHGDDDIRFWSRLVLASFMWPFILPAAIYWVVCKAFDRHFPSFTKEA